MRKRISRRTSSKKFIRIRLLAALTLVGLLFVFQNTTISLGHVLFYQTMPNLPLITEVDFVRFTEQEHPLGRASTGFDITQIQQELILDRYENLVGMSDIENILWDRENFTSYVTSFNLQFSYSELYYLRNVNTFLNRFFSMDGRTGIIEKYLDIDYFLSADLSIEQSDYPRVLIFHTHAASEFFYDSPNTTNLRYGIVGVGATLANILRTQYGINVIHYTGVYDEIDGRIVRSGAYERIEQSIRNILAQNPTIELVIDLHRDGVPASADINNFRTNINGRYHAAIMFVNGLSAVNEDGYIRHLPNIPNPYTRTNLALSFNLQMAFANRFPGLTRRLYLTPFRYVNHLTPLSALVEVGTQLSTMEEAHNSMEPLAYILYSVLFSK